MNFTKASSFLKTTGGLRFTVNRIVLLCLLVLSPSMIYAQEVYDEISVFVEIPRMGGTDIEAVIKDEKLYLPVTDLFDFLKIRNIPATDLETISGFFISPGAEYNISRTENQIVYQEKTYPLNPGDLIRTESNLFLLSSYFGSVFGLDCSFSFRSLAVTVTSKLELPMIREMKQEEMRRNLSRLKGEVVADTNIARTRSLFKVGVADWSAIASEEVDGKSEARLNLGLGGMIAGGEATASISYDSKSPFNERQQYYLWRYVNNEFTPLRQIMVGKIQSNAISTLYSPVIGIQLTNTPTTFRRSFGTYTLSDKTEPGWVVELYVNNVLVDYVKSDASGFFKFEVPLVYGNSIVQLKYFGPWGEERTREQNINIPFNFLPEKTVEYNVSAGITEDSLASRFTRANLSYGVTRRLTAGGGIEYFSALADKSSIPYVNASLSLFNNLLLSGEYAYGVRSKATLNWRLPSNLQIDMNYTKYDKDQKAISYNYLEERKVVLSMPVKIGKFSAYQRFSVNQIIMPGAKYSTGEWMFSGSFFGVNTNLATYGLFIAENKPNYYSNLSLALRLPAGFVIMPQAQFSYSENELLSVKAVLDKRLGDHAYLNISLEKNLKNNLKMGELGLRYDFSFAQTGASVRQSDKKTSFVQYARGSFIYDRKSKYKGFDNRTNLGKGGIAITAFIDINGNGKKDKGEPKAAGLNLHTNGGRVERNDRDTTIRVLGLEAYTNCFIDLDATSFDNIAWKLPVQTLSVAVDPDIIKNIELPITVAGEATGTVLMNKEGEEKGIGRIIINFYNANKRLIGKTLSEDDGYFSYFGLVPGEYSVSADSSQLRRLNMIPENGKVSFTLEQNIDGDIAEGIRINLKMKVDTSVPKVIEAEEAVHVKDTSYLVIHEVVQELITITEDSYAIQLGAFRTKANADGLRRKLQDLLGRKVEIIVENDYYKVRINEIKERKDVDDIIVKLQKNGITELWVISLRAKQQQMVITEKQDSIRSIVDIIRFGPDFYKLKVGNGSVLEPTVLNLMPKINNLEMDENWVKHVEVPEFKAEEGEVNAEESTTIRTIIRLNSIDRKFEYPIFSKNRDYFLVKTRLKTIDVKPQPKFSLQVAVYDKQSLAQQAKRKIESRLKLPVEIVQQWEFYKVIIPGFYTREETFRYYPELAGIGYPNITLIEEK